MKELYFWQHMNIKLLFLSLFFNVFIIDGFSQNTIPDCSQIQNVAEVLKYSHFQPVPLISVLNRRVTELLIKNLDPEGLLFTASDTSSLMNKKVFEDFESSSSACQFLKFASAIYLKSIKRADSIISVCERSPLNFNENQTISFNQDSVEYASDIVDLGNLWKKQLKLSILNKWGSDVGDSIKISAFQIDSFFILENDIRKEITKTLHCRMDKLIERCTNHPNYLSDIFLNCLTHSYDPHSDYFNITDLQEFEDMLSSESLSFGFSLDENKHSEIEISAVNPHSKLFSTGEITEGDVVLSLQIQNEVPIDIDLLLLFFWQ